MTCAELSPLLAERASGPLAPSDEARAAAHLAGCGSCRTLSARFEEALALSRPPAAWPAEERLSRDLPGLTAAAARRPRERSLGLGLGLAAAAAAAAVVLVLPARINREQARAPEVATAQVAQGALAPTEFASWEATDADALWELSDDIVLDLE